MITSFNTAVPETASEILGKHRRKKKPWVTTEILDMCDGRRELRKKRFEPQGSEKYKWKTSYSLMYILISLLRDVGCSPLAKVSRSMVSERVSAWVALVFAHRRRRLAADSPTDSVAATGPSMGWSWRYSFAFRVKSSALPSSPENRCSFWDLEVCIVWSCGAGAQPPRSSASLLAMVTGLLLSSW